jgi:osmotically inducible lipoprotein OsmB
MMDTKVISMSMRATRTRRTPPVVGMASLAILTIGCLSLAAQRQEYRGPIAAQMSGTYNLDSTRGDNPQRAVETATRSLPPDQRDRAYQGLLSRLVPPQTISIDRNGLTVSIASSRGPRSAFDADGLTRSERDPNGRMVSTRASMNGNGTLTVSTSGGGRGADFSVTFESLNSGDGLRVTRRLDDDTLIRPVVIQSYYLRAEGTPRWDVYASGPRYGSASGMMVVPDGTQLLATLDTPLSMRTSRDGEPFTMTVRSAGQFQGARINGVISRVNTYRESGNGGDMRVDFQTIELSGRSSEFAAVLNTVRLFDGTVLRVNAEGNARNVNSGDTTVRNGGIGAAVGAIIGAVVGGGKGAVVGAVVGGTGGVILSQGQEQLDLPPGTEVTLTVLAGYRGPSS